MRFQARAINENVYRAISRARLPPVSFQGRGPTRQSRVIGNLNVELEKPGDGAKEAFGLPQGQTIDRSDGQSSLNGRV